MIIDAHAHAAGDYSTAASITEVTKRYGIGKILLCTSPKNNLDLKEPPSFPLMKSPNSIFLLNRMLRFGYHSFIKDNGDGNKHVFDLSQQVPEIVVPFLWVNPLDPLHMDNLEKSMQDHRCKGIKLHQAWNSFTIDGQEFNRLVEVARANRLPIFIHPYSKKETRKLVRFITGHQDAIFIIGHMLGLDIFKEKHDNIPNVFFDTSGSARVRGEDILEAINSFGDEHIVFGTDTPYAKIEDQIRKIDQLGLSDRAEENIFKSNILNLLSLDV